MDCTEYESLMALQEAGCLDSTETRGLQICFERAFCCKLLLGFY